MPRIGLIYRAENDETLLKSIYKIYEYNVTNGASLCWANDFGNFLKRPESVSVRAVLTRDRLEHGSYGKRTQVAA
jgi:hypothetical protein